MTTSEKIRENLLLKGLGRPVALNAVDWKIKQDHPSASTSEVQDETLEVMRTLVDDGLFTLGAVRKHRFVSSKRSLDRSMHRISRRYVGHYDRPEGWMFTAWMKLTDRGEQLALALEQRVLDAYRDSWAGSDRCENVVTPDFSARDMAALEQLRAQVAEWRQDGDLLSRAVA
jgi:hypothetical protein